MASERSELLHLLESGQRSAFRRRRRQMRWRRIKQLWIGFGLALGRIVSPIMLGILFVTVFLPFGLIGMLVRPPRGWRKPRRRAGTEVGELRLQA